MPNPDKGQRCEDDEALSNCLKELSAASCLLQADCANAADKNRWMSAEKREVSLAAAGQLEYFLVAEFWPDWKKIILFYVTNSIGNGNIDNISVQYIDRKILSFFLYNLFIEFFNNKI